MKQVNLRIYRTILTLLLGLFLSAGAYAQQISVKGTVKDQNGEPVIGANVLVKGTTNGVITDVDGKFALQTTEKDVLEISFLGYKTQEVKASSKPITIILQEDAELLDEVVVIGYGTSRKEDLSTAVSTVKMDDKLKSRPANLGSYLQGQMPGVMIQSNGGDPMSDVSLSIRGRGSRGTDDSYNSGDGVLYVVDGVPGAPFNMEDVESITVLKDAASAAIYGASVGSGGVVVVTTKQASAGKVKVNINISKSFKNAVNLPETLTAEEYNRIWADACTATGDPLHASRNPEIFPYGNVTRTDWMDAIFRTGSLEHYALSLSGGSDTMKGFASFAYDDDKGVLLNTYARKFSAKANLDFQVVKWLKVSERVSYEYKNGQGDVGTGHEGVLNQAVFFPRSASIYDYDKEGKLMIDEKTGKPLYHGTIPRWASAEGINSPYGEMRNPVAMLERLDQIRPSNRIYSTTSFELKPVSGLTVKSDFTAGIDIRTEDIFNCRVPEIGRPNSDNSRDKTNTWNSKLLWETTATYAKVFADKHHFSLMAGYSMSYEKYKYDAYYTTGYVNEDRHSITNGQAGEWSKFQPEENIWEESMLSVFARLGYSYEDRYFLTASVRRDATSKLYKDNNSGVFPAFSTSWKISSEEFFEPLKNVVNLLKVRGSWGQVGNVALVPRYSWNVPLNETDWAMIYGKDLNNIVYGGVYAGSIGTKDLKWETTEQWGVGLDMGLLDNSLNLTVDYFNKRTKDLIEVVPVPSVAGISVSPYGNVGDVVNRGWEFGLSYSKKIGHVTFGVNGNLSTVHNEVLDLGNLEFMQHNVVINSLTPLRSAVGHPWYSYYVLKTEGIFQSQEEIDNFTWRDPETGIKQKVQPNAKPGDFKYVDFNNDGKITDDDKQYLGSYMPKITFGFGGNLQWKGIDFSFQFQGVGKSTVYNGFKQMGYTGRGQGGNMLADVKNSWEYNKTSGVPRIGLISDPNGNYNSLNDFFLEDASYLRLKNVTIGYTLPDNVMRAIGLPGSTARFYLNGENLFTATDYSGIDPEVGNFGIDGGTYPVARSFSIGFNFSF
ncbi:SusC/RagA family TonB-linked outer membrane protein [Bacteroides uniformis]|jgi:tonB-linked outer membrane protein, susC/ragA family|uniref:SusC/RagA family TonB-linked outer membrane protein n=1 Tax=Bacteroides uniformis TaxID=820 RepID=UPI00101C4E20|nr:TonB-dependent receptor [Bacteroides uniformis]